MLSEIKNMYRGYMGLITVAKSDIEWTPETFSQLYSAPYRTGSKGGELERMKIEKMVSQHEVERAQKNGQRVLCSLQERPLSTFRINFRVLNVVTKRDLYPKASMGKCIDSLG